MEACSIFNEVIGPVMIGPSSSHTAGPSRIGKAIHMLLKDEVQDIKIAFEELSAYAATYKAQGSDYGFVGGILGMNTIDEAIKTSLDEAKKRGIGVEFLTIAKAGRHPNFSQITVTGKSGAKVIVESNSTGGGMFEIIKYQEFPIYVKGAGYEVLAICENQDAFQKSNEILKGSKIEKQIVTVTGEGSRKLLNVKTEESLEQEILKALSAVEGVHFREITPILPVVKKKNAKPPFMVSEEALKYGEAKELWELACDYEGSISGKSQEEILRMMQEIGEIMKDSAMKALTGNYERRGFLPPQTAVIVKNLEKSKEKYLDLGMLNDAVLWASAVMEYDICRGRTVAAPTGGSSGVLPGGVVCIGEKLGFDMGDIAKALMASGLIGVFISHQASFAGEVCGCQAENGSASAMAAAGIVQLLGGTAKEGFQAAALALQNMLGLICDPVAGVGNIPCVSRNSMATANAVISANMVLNGFDPYIPLDETIDAMWQVGRLMPPEHLCSGQGGLCATKTGKRVLEELGY